MKVRDLPAAGRPVVLVWSKRLWRCTEPGYSTATWSETHPGIGQRMSVTERARPEMCRRVGEDEDSVAEVARAFGVGWGAAMRGLPSEGLVRDDRRPCHRRPTIAILATVLVGSTRAPQQSHRR